MKTASIAIAVGCLILSVFMWTVLSGAVYGFFYGVFKEPPADGFAAGGPNHYQSLNIWYFSISFCLGVVLAAKFFKQTIVVGGLCVLLLVFCTVSTWNMVQYKYLVLEALRKGSFFWFDLYPWLSSSVYSGWFCIAAFAVLLIIEIWMMRSSSSDAESIMG